MEKKEIVEEMPRGQFLRQLGLSTGALMAFYCMGTGLTSCTSKKDDPAPVVPDPVFITKIDFTLDLTNNDYKSLKTEGEFLVKDNIIIANAAGKFVALSKICTHEGSTIAFRKAENDFKCPNHGSGYALDGSVLNGPTTTALKTYKTELLENNNKLRVFE